MLIADARKAAKISAKYSYVTRRNCRRIKLHVHISFLASYEQLIKTFPPDSRGKEIYQQIITTAQRALSVEGLAVMRQQ